MNTEQFRNFAVAYRTHNFSAATRAIPMSAQRFTKSIRTLENELGVPLFKRDEKTGLHVPTAYADEFITYVNAIESHFQIVKKAFRRIQAEENARVLLGSSLGIIGFLGRDFFEGFKAENPGVTLHYTEMNDLQCDEHLAEEDFGLAFTLAPYHGDFETVELYSTPVCLWVNEQDELGERERMSIADLDGRSLAMPGVGFKCYSNILERCHAEGVAPKTVLQLSEMFWLYNFAYEGKGLAFSAEHLGRLPFFSGKGVRCIPLDGVMWRFGVSSPPKHRFTEPERLFRKYCIEYFSGLSKGAFDTRQRS